MKLKLLLLTFILVCTGCKNDPRIQAAYDLIERVTPGPTTAKSYCVEITRSHWRRRSTNI